VSIYTFVWNNRTLIYRIMKHLKDAKSEASISQLIIAVLKKCLFVN